MTVQTGQPAKQGRRALSERRRWPALAALALATAIAAASLVADGAAQLSAGLGVAVASADTLRLADAVADGPRRDIATGRSDRVARVAPRDIRATAGPEAAKPAAPDPRRLAALRGTRDPVPSVGAHAWIPGLSETGSTAEVERRIALASVSALPEPVLPDLTEGEAAAEAGIPVPEQRPRIAAAPSPVTANVAAAPERPRTEGGARKSGGTALAYADPEKEVEEETRGGIFGRLFGRRNESLLPGRGSKVAVYDISAKTVYMPNGEKLEAHSGLGKMKDNPRYVHVKNKGPTPPNLYKLRMRESRFHGVEAIRLLPADGKKKYNRDGLLAHTYMYVRGGGKDKSQSNGCVVFKDYDKFLAAFKRGEVKHMIVVPNLKEVPTYMAAL
ncbi:DUF2778 domain-containing protein [Oricola thermophila]|uniref:DUF2778 domain-containing protein n=1 Tax=Oricola thermophila TaxID=2742145 RepID=UPI001FE4B81B|nr:DUF2778 domain-containing protein [Oricola thermophila]